MRKKAIKHNIAVFNILIGVLAMMGTLYGEYVSTGTIVLEIIFIVAGILLLIPFKSAAEKVIVIIEFVFYCFGVFLGLVLFFTDILMGTVALIIYAIPFTLSILYLVRYKKEKEIVHNYNNNDQIASLTDSAQNEQGIINVYELGIKYYEEKEYKRALEMFSMIPDYSDTKLRILAIKQELLDLEKDELLKQSNTNFNSREERND